MGALKTTKQILLLLALAFLQTSAGIESMIKDFVENAMTLFNTIIYSKYNALLDALDKGEISREYFDKNTYLFKRRWITENAPLPAPDTSDK